MIKCLLTEFGRAGRENIWLSVMTHGPRCARSVRHDLEPNIFPSGPPTQSISTKSLVYLQIRERFKRRMNAVFPSPNNGNQPMKLSRVNPSEVSAVRAVRVQSCSEFELK